MVTNTTVRISPREQAALVGLMNQDTWEVIGKKMQISQRSVARYIASARLKLGFNPQLMIERSSLIQRAQQAGALTPGMRLSNSGYIVFSTSSIVRGR